MEPYRAAVGPNRTDRRRTEPKRIVILEFADKAAFKRWSNSPEYQKILPGRLDDSTGRALIIESGAERREQGLSRAGNARVVAA